MSTIKLARIFSDKAVLQRGKDIRIWGFSAAGDKVQVSFAGKAYECVADENGRFEITAGSMFWPSLYLGAGLP